MAQVLRFFVERKDGFRQEAEGLVNTLKTDLGIDGVESIRLFHRYDLTDCEKVAQTPNFKAILAEPQTDILTAETLPESIGQEAWIWAVESLPGQYDQREDSCAQCIEVVSGVRPKVRTATVYAVYGKISEAEKAKIKGYLINPVERREAALEKPASLEAEAVCVEDVALVEGLISADEKALEGIIQDFGLAMDLDDLLFMQDYFKNTLKRNPTETELRVIDTYWSDHCRHTTFNTALKEVAIAEPEVQQAYENYQAIRAEVYGKETTRKETLMDIATLSTKWLKKNQAVVGLDESEEINACSVKIKIDTTEGPQDWLYMFKNETHNHPTEIEPFGGAATCLGGAIRDPLSGRSYVYQGLRLTGAANPLKKMEETLVGKLPQRQICTLAAKGFSSYGNQIGLATGLVDEIYHPGYEAKRMEVGAVIAAAPAENVVRERPEKGDIVVLVGGRTGRDGCGGATGSSKTHTEESLTTAGAEVQKGNPVEERKIQRLFRRPEIAKRIKRCNDFGAGGVSVSVGELADGVKIYLERVPKKYAGLNPTELAISESQERMSCVIAAEDWPLFEKVALEENLEATVIADITDDDKVTMLYEGKTIVSLDRSFVESAGAPKETKVRVDAFSQKDPQKPEKVVVNFKELLLSHAQDLNVCSKRGLIENFDATIGAGSVLMPLGGKNQLTPSQVMAAKIPLLKGETEATSLFTYGFDAETSDLNPYRGAYLAIVESMTRLIAAGAPMQQVYLSLQEYFPSLKNDPSRWGRPFAALLGAFQAQLDFKVPAIGGKDSMSGSFEELDVPATLISFATTVTTADRVVSSDLKAVDSKLYLVQLPKRDALHIDGEALKAFWESFANLLKEGKILSTWSVSRGGVLEGLMKMAFGNGIGVKLNNTLSQEQLVEKAFGSIIVEAKGDLPEPFVEIGETQAEASFVYGNESVALETVREAWEATLEPVYPTKARGQKETEVCPKISYTKKNSWQYNMNMAKPKAVIPVFPGTNCEVDTARQIIAAGGDVETVLVANLTPSLLQDSVARMEKALASAQFMVFPGGFSFGDEPDGSGKFIATFFRHEALKKQIHDLLYKRDGLMLGICNGFQALIKLGLLPYGEIRDLNAEAPTLTFNTIGRHQSRYVKTRIASTNSPWLREVAVDDIHQIAISHGEGRFVCSDHMLEELIANGQVATQYVNALGEPSMAIEDNPNGSLAAIEGLLSKDGRIFGKMGHSERIGSHIAKNISGAKDQGLFRSGISYFTGEDR